MIQDGDINCEQVVEQLQLQVSEAAEILGRKKISLAGAIYLSNVVIMHGSLSGDGNNGGYSYMIALVKDGTIQKGDVLAGGGGASLAFDNANLLLSSARMEDGGPGIGCRHCVCTRMD